MRRRPHETVRAVLNNAAISGSAFTLVLLELHVMNKIIWLVGAVVIVIAILSWLGLR